MIKIMLIAVGVMMAGVPLYALPATLSLPPGRRPGLEPLTILEAAWKLKATGRSGLELIEEAHALVAQPVGV
jgi:hypothetical protein